MRSRIEQMAYDVLDTEMQHAVDMAGGVNIGGTMLTNLLLVQLLRDSMREVVDVAGGDHGTP